MSTKLQDALPQYTVFFIVTAKRSAITLGIEDSLSKHEAYLKHFYVFVFRDSVELEQLQMAGKLELTLVDHHVLS
jgi:hypothetical protein